MKINVKNKTAASSLKRKFIETAQNACNAFMMPGGLLADWNVADVKHGEDSERCVEIPWTASGVSRCAGLWLDIGYAHAEPRYWDSIPLNTLRRYLRYGYGLDIADPKYPHPMPVEVTADLVTDDISALPQFNLITCISTLEHIGCDNSVYLANAGRQNNPLKIQQDVLAKLLSQLTARGRLLLSVPYGKHQDNGWFMQYDAATLRALLNAAANQKYAILSESYYKLSAGGWTKCRAEDMTEVLYKPEEKRAAGVVLLEIAGRDK